MAAAIACHTQLTPLITLWSTMYGDTYRIAVRMYGYNLSGLRLYWLRRRLGKLLIGGGAVGDSDMPVDLLVPPQVVVVADVRFLCCAGVRCLLVGRLWLSLLT